MIISDMKTIAISIDEASLAAIDRMAQGARRGRGRKGGVKRSEVIRRAVREFIVRMCAGYQATLSRLPAHYMRIKVPTLVLWGEKDRHFPPVHAERLHATIAGSELTIVPDGEHWMIWDRAPEIAMRIETFVEAHPPTT